MTPQEVRRIEELREDEKLFGLTLNKRKELEMLLRGRD